MVDREQHHGFDELRLDDRPTHRHNGFVRKYRCAFRHRPDVAGKPEGPQILEKRLVEQLFAAQISDVSVGEAQVLQILHQLLHPRHDGQPSVVRDAAEKHVEICDFVHVAGLKEPVSHGQLVKIGQHGQVVGLKNGIVRLVHVCQLPNVILLNDIAV